MSAGADPESSAGGWGGVNYGERGSASLSGGLPVGARGKAPGQGVRGTKSP